MIYDWTTKDFEEYLWSIYYPSPMKNMENHLIALKDWYYTNKNIGKIRINRYNQMEFVVHKGTIKEAVIRQPQLKIK